MESPRAAKVAPAPERTEVLNDRREFVRSAGGIVLALAFGGSCKIIETIPTGTLRATVQGLGASPSSGGVATITGAGGTRQVVEVPLFGSVEVPLDVGDYVVTYSPPPFFSVVSGQSNAVQVAVAEAGVSAVTFDVTSILGAVVINVSGLSGSVQNGGSATVRNVLNPDQPAQTVSVDANGVGRISLAPGTYSVSYSPPSGFSILGSGTNASEVIVSSDAERMVAFTVGVVVPASAVVFHSDWGTARGQTADAFRDTAKAKPWTAVYGSTEGAIVSSDGLDFPSPNVLEITTRWNGSGSSSFLARLENVLPVPAIGQSLFYRWYVRMVVPDSLTTWGTPHPIQDGFDAGRANWEFGARRTGAGLWKPRFNCTGNSWPLDSWILRSNLSTNKTYRFELQLHRISDTEFNLHARIFDSAGVQIYSDADFLSSDSKSSLAANPGMKIKSAATFAGFNAGSNGAFQGTTSTDHPVTFCYQGCIAIRTDDWCGAYMNGV